MPIVRLTDGTEVECTLDELQSVVSQLADVIIPGGVIPPKKREARNKNPGAGPRRRWAMAEWYSLKVGATKDDARKLLVKLKRESPRQFFDVDEEFKAFLAWYAQREKITPVEKAMEALTSVHKVNPEQYKALMTEFAKKKSNSKTASRK